ncbi:hypothetical protein [Parasphingorhabdus sp.]|uniref:hypothetical protein n=1 Tax=Parasphingorhabdus sp. TaxID=2709688 RepID=UPI003D2B1888
MVASGTSRSIPFQPHIGTDKPSLAIRSKSFGQLSHGYIGIEWEHFAKTWRHQNLEKKVVPPTGTDLNLLFDVLAEWNDHLEALDVADLADWGMEP